MKVCSFQDWLLSTQVYIILAKEISSTKIYNICSNNFSNYQAIGEKPSAQRWEFKKCLLHSNRRSDPVTWIINLACQLITGLRNCIAYGDAFFRLGVSHVQTAEIKLINIALRTLWYLTRDNDSSQVVNVAMTGYLNFKFPLRADESSLP